MRGALLLALLFIATAASSAITTTAMRGRVTSGGRPARHVTVTVTSAALQQARTAVTSARGTYWIGALPPGEYDVTFSRPGLQTLTRQITVELARIARADATLEASEDEETITATMKTIGVSDTMAITTHRTAEMLDLFPEYGDARAARYATGGVPILADVPVETDDFRFPDLMPAETIDEMTFLQGAQPIEIARGKGEAVRVRTLSGGEELSISLRDTITSHEWIAGVLPLRLEKDDKEHFFELAGGGRILRDRLWFFAGGWAGDRAEDLTYENRGVVLKLTSQLNPRHNLVAEHLDAERDTEPFSSGDLAVTTSFLRHTAQWSPRLLTEIVAGRTLTSQAFDSLTFHLRDETPLLAAKATFAAGDHVFSGGVEIARNEIDDLRFVFLSDRWTSTRWTVMAAIGHEAGDVNRPLAGVEPPQRKTELSGQFAVSYDLLGDGRHAIIGTASRYADPSFADAEEATLSFASAIGSSGVVRIDAVHREYDRNHVNSLQADAYYRLFDRFRIGGNYTYANMNTAIFPDHTINAWFSAELPLGSHTIGATIVQRYERGFRRVNFVRRDEYATTDVALRYTFPIRRVATTIAADGQNLFDGGNDFEDARRFRLWVRARL
ncbi:MAG TPA: TonB-dependent receptor [Thermoanaerobaculia bacterium]|nr:TonB-dependent receptor [Thermoanaerobaculia bacterium]